MTRDDKATTGPESSERPQDVEETPGLYSRVPQTGVEALMTQLTAQGPEGPEVMSVMLVTRLAHLWSVLFNYRHGGFQNASPEVLFANDQALRETAGILYRFRAALEMMLPAETYDLLAEAAGFAQFEVAARKFEETGDFDQATKAYVEAIERVAREVGVDLQGPPGVGVMPGGTTEES